MAKGENIFRRRDGRWEARYIKGRELSGKIKYGYCYASVTITLDRYVHSSLELKRDNMQKLNAAGM